MKKSTKKQEKVTRFIARRLSMPAKSMPIDIGIIHLVGIGGIGMSGIAEILHNLGYHVTGSDVSENANVLRLKNLGIEVRIGHKASNIEKASVVVKSTAVALSNPEIVAAREKQIPVVKRSEMLAELTHLKATIAVAGSHGKTTTTSLVAKVLEAAKMDPTVINGGIINTYGTNAHLGSGEWLVAEADESDGTFIKIPATIGVVTNIDPEHLDHWGSYDALKNGFRTFLENLPFYGFAVLCHDDPNLKALAYSITDRRIITYGVDSKEADIRAINIKSKKGAFIFDVVVSGRVMGVEKNKIMKNITLPIPGIHNVKNALAAIGVAMELKIEDSIIISAFKNFGGVKRRFTKTGEVDGVTIIDDYGHHPTEIAATLKAARDVVGKNKKVIAVLQPHRYSRLESLFVEFSKCFSDADRVIISEVYAAGEMPRDGVNRETLIDALKANGINAEPLSSPAELSKLVKKITKVGDIVVCLGAGSITAWANSLPEELKLLKKS